VQSHSDALLPHNIIVNSTGLSATSDGYKMSIRWNKKRPHFRAASQKSWYFALLIFDC